MKYRLLVTAYCKALSPGGGVGLGMQVLEFDTEQERAAAARALTLSNKAMGAVLYDFVPL